MVSFAETFSHHSHQTKVKPPTDDPIIIAIKSTNNRFLSCLCFMISHYISQSGSITCHSSRLVYPKLDPPVGRPVLFYNMTQVSTRSSGFQTFSNSKVRPWPFSGRHSLPCKVSCDRRCLWLKLTSPKFE